MAADQRYCLNCGLRGAEARLPFLDILRSDPEAQLVPYGQSLPQLRSSVGGALPPPAVGFQERMRVNSGLIAGVGVLLLAMLVGVLIGSAGDDQGPLAATPPPQVISIAGGGAAPPVAAAPTAATGATGAAEDSAAAKADGGSGSPAPSRAPKARAPAAATNNAVKDLDKLTGAAREKAVDKLGKKIATGGKPPPKDSKPAGAGGDFQEIG